MYPKASDIPQHALWYKPGPNGRWRGVAAFVKGPGDIGVIYRFDDYPTSDRVTQHYDTSLSAMNNSVRHNIAVMTYMHDSRLNVPEGL